MERKIETMETAAAFAFLQLRKKSLTIFDGNTSKCALDTGQIIAKGNAGFIGAVRSKRSDLEA